MSFALGAPDFLLREDPALQEAGTIFPGPHNAGPAFLAYPLPNPHLCVTVLVSVSYWLLSPLSLSLCGSSSASLSRLCSVSVPVCLNSLISRLLFLHSLKNIFPNSFYSCISFQSHTMDSCQHFYELLKNLFS